MNVRLNPRCSPRMALLMTAELLFAVGLALGQAVSVAGISGRVLDPSGAVIANAQVRMTQTDTHYTRVVSTDTSGNYEMTNLPVGPYTLEVQAAGFKTYTQPGIVLEVANNIQVNVTLQIGAVSETVEVSANAGMVETRSNAVAQVVNERQINDLPLNGRQATQLILVSGASAPTPADSLNSSKNYPTSVTMSIAGGQGNSTNYVLDGGDNNHTFTNLNLPFPFPDALQEFNVETSALPAQNGLHPGGQVNIVTKSGTNSFHGDLFEYIRNGDLNARNFFAPTHDSLKRNQFGGTLGGPILKDKLFFFGGYQGTRTRTSPPQTISYVPTAAVLEGDFSTLESSTCQSKPRQLTNPVTKEKFAGNQIPVSMFDPAALKLVYYLPPAQNQCGQVTYGIPQAQDEDQYIGRIDYVRSDKHSMYARYFASDYRSPAFWNPHNILWTAIPGNLELSQSITLGDTYSFSANLLNSFHATFTRLRNNRGPSSQDIDPQDLGINMYNAVPNDIRMEVSNYFNIGCGTCSPGHFNTNTWQFADDVNLVRGNHQMMFGVDFIRSQNNDLSGYLQNGDFQFNGSFTGDALADFLLGDMYQFNTSRPQQDAFRQSIPALYFQDTIHVNDRLTVNAGVRWEPMLFPYDYFARGSSFNMAAFLANQHSTKFPNAPAGMLYYGDPGIPKGYSNAKWTELGPRFGLVFNPHADGRDTLRVGAGILYDTTEMYYTNHLTSNPPFANEIDQIAPASHLSNPWAGYPGGDPFPVSGYTIFPKFAVWDLVPLNMKPTTVDQWNVSYQRQFAGNWMASVSYLGNKTTHLWLQDDINPAIYMAGATSSNTNQRRTLYLLNPSQGQYYGQMLIGDDGANSFYHGMLTSLQHRFSNGFTLLGNYTWSHCIDDGDFTGDVHVTQYQDPYSRRADRGSCNFDYRHVFNLAAVATSSFKNGWKGRILGNWQIAPLIRATSGAALNVTTGLGNSLVGNNPNTDRPNLVSSDVYNSSWGPNLQYLNPGAFVINAPGTFGNLGRNVLNGPAQLNLDVSLVRFFPLTERWHLEARGEAFNVINHTNFQLTNLTLNSSSTFGHITSAGDPRIFQFALKLHF